MDQKIEETDGLILFSKNHRESDKLVKIFTARFGKVMFFIKRGNKPQNTLKPAVLSFTRATYIGNIRSEGLSFLNAAKDVQYFQTIQQDIFLNAYATYLLNLADAAIEDHVSYPTLYQKLVDALTYMDEGVDAEIITNIFELQLLPLFGITLEWRGCTVCGETKGAMDYSRAYSGLLCQNHWYMDPYRAHFESNIVKLLQLFARMPFEQLGSISVKFENKQKLRTAIDILYEEHVGLHLKSKKFIDEMQNWEAMMKKKPKKDEQ